MRRLPLRLLSEAKPKSARPDDEPEDEQDDEPEDEEDDPEDDEEGQEPDDGKQKQAAAIPKVSARVKPEEPEEAPMYRKKVKLLSPKQQDVERRSSRQNRMDRLRSLLGR